MRDASWMPLGGELQGVRRGSAKTVGSTRRNRFRIAVVHMKFDETRR
jgi:hypothetical protein